VSSAALEEVKRLPFGNYDLTVYFGMGILALPLCYNIFVAPFGLYFPKFPIPFKSEFTNSAVSVIAVLFSGYALGHIIAFLASYFIEKFLHRNYGYPSDLYIEQCDSGELRILRPIRVFPVFSSLPSIVINAFHLPLLPIYLVVHNFTKLGYYSPKLPLEFRGAVDVRLKLLRLNISVAQNTRWSKTVEHYVANNCPAGYARMYNYLVISGVMRSIAFLSILYCWFYVAHGILSAQFDTNGYLVAMHFRGIENYFYFAVGYILVSSFATLSMMTFAKFNRRFFEEGLQSFLLFGTEMDAPKATPLRKKREPAETL